MFTTLRNAWKIPELRKKLFFVLLILLILLYVAMQSGISISKPISYVIITLFAATGLYKIGTYLRDYIFRS